MLKIVESTAKIVFLIMAIAVVVLTFIGIIDPKDFMVLASMTFTFYFANKGDANEKYLGK